MGAEQLQVGLEMSSQFRRPAIFPETGPILVGYGEAEMVQIAIAASSGRRTTMRLTCSHPYSQSLIPIPPMPNAVRYLVFDIESVADAPLVAKLRYPGQSLDAGRSRPPLSRRADGEIRKRLHPLHLSGSDLRGGGQGDGRFPPGRRGGARTSRSSART